MQTNTQLEKLLETFDVSEKDSFEIRQIFFLLPSEKKKNLLRNFPKLAQRLQDIQENISVEREILLWNIMTDLEQAVEQERRHRIVMGIH